MQYLKIAIVHLLRLILKIFYIFPINDKRIIFVSYKGKQHCCNPKYIFEYIYYKYGKNYEYVWCLNNELDFPNEYKNVKIIKYLKLKYLYYIITSKYIINNLFIEAIFPTRKGQIIVNTWHGCGAYKKIGASVPAFNKERKYLEIVQNIRAKENNHYIVSAYDKYKIYMSEDWKVSEDKYLKTGLPRNDIIFSGNTFKEKVAKYFDIAYEIKIILYAPTFRGHHYNSQPLNISFSIDELLLNLKKKFNDEYVFLYRGHLYSSNINIPDGVIVASDYPDMQELLCATDILITDYSSSMWDFSLVYKPCFIYAPDINKYEDDDRGFYTPIYEWPFPIAETNEQLMNNIMQFDKEKYDADVKAHHDALGSYEKGTATKQFCELIFGNNIVFNQND